MIISKGVFANGREGNRTGGSTERKFSKQMSGDASSSSDEEEVDFRENEMLSMKNCFA